MAQSNNPSQNPQPQSKPAPPAERPCLLVVDDDSAIRAMLETALENNYSVICLPNGEQVLRSIEDHSPRLLVLDINLPGSDGYEICGKVRSHAKQKKLPVLFMTIRKDNATFLKSLESGGDAVICKPFIISDLRERIEHLLHCHES
jgi:DNA-binding response OmpR family regulator